MCPPLNAANDDLLHLEITPKRSSLSGQWRMICWFFQKKKRLCALSLFRTRLKQPRIKQILAMNKRSSRLLLQKSRSVMMMLAVWNKVGSGGEVGSCAAQAARSRNSSTSLQLIHLLIFSSSTGTSPQSCPCWFPALLSPLPSCSKFFTRPESKRVMTMSACNSRRGDRGDPVGEHLAEWSTPCNKDGRARPPLPASSHQEQRQLCQMWIYSTGTTLLNRKCIVVLIKQIQTLSCQEGIGGNQAQFKRKPSILAEAKDGAFSKFDPRLFKWSQKS